MEPYPHPSNDLTKRVLIRRLDRQKWCLAKELQQSVRVDPVTFGNAAHGLERDCDGLGDWHVEAHQTLQTFRPAAVGIHGDLRRRINGYKFGQVDMLLHCGELLARSIRRLTRQSSRVNATLQLAFDPCQVCDSPAGGADAVQKVQTIPPDSPIVGVHLNSFEEGVDRLAEVRHRAHRGAEVFGFH